MTPHMFRTLSSLQRDDLLQDLSNAQQFVSQLPDRCVSMSEWSCHALVRAFFLVPTALRWVVQDGHFGRYGTEHSWLWYQDQDLIMDVYPVAGCTPFIVEARFSPWNGIYLQNDRVYAKVTKDSWEKQGLEALHAWKNATPTRHAQF